MRGFFPFGYAQVQNDKEKQRHRQQQSHGKCKSQNNGVVAGRALAIPPIAKCAMDGAPVFFVAVGGKTKTEADPQRRKGGFALF